MARYKLLRRGAFLSIDPKLNKADKYLYPKIHVTILLMLRRVALSNETFLSVDPKLNKAEGSDTGDKPPAVPRLVVLEYYEVLL